MLSRWHTAFAITVICAGFCPAPAKADVLIGASDTDRTFPFDLYFGEYQQVYSRADFSGPTEIGSITFFPASDHPDDTISGSYTLSLSTTSKTVNGLSGTYSDNLGPDNAVFFTGSVSNTLTFTGAPFLYNPAKGNLLLDIFVTSDSGSGSGYGEGNFLAGGTASDTSRDYNPFGVPGVSGFVDGVGLETEFSTPAVPEPSYLLLVGIGVLGLCLRWFEIGKRRRTLHKTF